jgi:hypothetical protein
MVFGARIASLEDRIANEPKDRWLASLGASVSSLSSPNASLVRELPFSVYRNGQPRNPLEALPHAALVTSSSATNYVATPYFGGLPALGLGPTGSEWINNQNMVFVSATPSSGYPSEQSRRHLALGSVAEGYAMYVVPTLKSLVSEEFDRLRASEAFHQAHRARRALPSHLAVAISERLIELTEIAISEQPDVALPSPESYRTLTSFLAANPSNIAPQLSVDEDGFVWARWRKSHSCYATLRCYPDGIINFTLVSADPKRPNTVLPVYGSATIGSTKAHIDAQPGLAWIFGIEVV